MILMKSFKGSNISHTLKWLSVFIICFGFILRFVQYMANRSLWLDESYLSLNIINRSFLGLLQPLQPFQVAPAGFLMVERLMVLLFGNSEYALRLFPFLCGVISLFLFYKLSKHYVREKAALIALGLFAISGPLIRYSAEVKQYSSDVTISLLLYLAAVYFQSKKLTVLRIALFGIIGAVAIWFSHPAVFILAGIGSVLLLFSLAEKEWSTIVRLLIVYLVWISSFAVCYFVFLGDTVYDQRLLASHGGSFMPFPPATISDAKWFIRKFFNMLNNPAGLYLRGIAALAFLTGCISMLSEKKKEFFLLTSPIIFVLLASGLHKYPFSDRFLLFIAPSLLILVAAGAERIINKTRHNMAVIGVFFAVLLFLYPTFFAVSDLIKPGEYEEIRPVVNYVSEHRQNGDVLYIYYAAQPSFKYYSERCDIDENDYIIGVKSIDDWENYIDDLNNLRGNKRVWVVFSHVWKKNGVDEEKYFLHYLDGIGERLDSFKKPGAAVYLYDLSGKGRKKE